MSDQQRRLAKAVRDLSLMSLEALELTYSNACEMGGADDPSLETREYAGRLCNLVDAVAMFRFGREWEARKYGVGLTHVGTVTIPAEVLNGARS